MSAKLQTKDLINIGIFTALYFVIFFACGMLGYIPLLFIMLPVIYPIVAGIPFSLFLTRVKKFGMVTIMGGILGLLMFATGHTWVPVVTGLASGLLADLILKGGKYSKFRNTVIATGVFSLWAIGAMLPMWVMQDSYFAYMRNSMGDEYANAILVYIQGWVLPLVILAAFVCGILGALLGRAVLKKHFQRAGIV